MVGTFARSVADTRLIYEALAGPDRADPMSRSRPPDHAQGPLRIRLVERLDNQPCAPEILAAVHRTADILRVMGHTVAPGPLDVDTAGLAAVWPAIAETGLARLMEREPQFRTLAAPRYVEMAERGSRHPATAVLATLEAVAAVRRQTSQLFAETDLILMPACAAMPWAADAPFPTEIDGQPVGARGHAIYTGWVNAAGHPAMSLPCPVEGLPIGAQLVADLGGEPLLLALAEAYAKQTPLFPRWPAIAEAEARS